MERKVSVSQQCHSSANPVSPRPALWIAIPTLLVSLAVIALMSVWPSLPAALVLAFAGAVAVGSFADARFAAIIASIRKIATGDRYQSPPELIGDGAPRDFAGAAETIRRALIEADTVAVD